MIVHAPTLAEENGTMHMALSRRRWTRVDLDRLPDDGNTYEVVRGDLFVTPPPRGEHKDAVTRLLHLIVPYLAQAKIGWIEVPRAVMIFEGSQVEPDLMVRPVGSLGLPIDRQPVPFLVVEVLSDSTARRDRTAKRSLYLDAGVAEYWMVDVERRTITVARRGVPDLVVTDRLAWQPVSGVEPLTFDVSDVTGI